MYFSVFAFTTATSSFFFFIILTSFHFTHSHSSNFAINSSFLYPLVNNIFRFLWFLSVFVSRYLHLLSLSIHFSTFYRCIQYKYLYLRQLFPGIFLNSIFVSTLFSIVTTDIDLSHLPSVIFSNPFCFSVYPTFFLVFLHHFLFRLFPF